VKEYTISGTVRDDSTRRKCSQQEFSIRIDGLSFRLPQSQATLSTTVRGKGSNKASPDRGLHSGLSQESKIL